MYLHKLFENAPIVRIDRRAVGDSFDLHMVVSGFVREFFPSSRGSKLVAVGLHGPGSVFGLSKSRFDALTDAEIKSIKINRQFFDGSDWRELAEMMESNLRFSQDLLAARVYNTRVRTALVLLSFAEVAGESGKIKLHLTHEVLASYVGTSRELVTNNLSSLRKSGAIKISPPGRRREIVVDLAKMRHLLAPIPARAA